MAIPESDNQNNWRSSLSIIVLVLSGVFAIIGEMVVRRSFFDWKLVSVPIHSAIEIIGAGIGIILAGLLLFYWKQKKDVSRYLWMSLALMGMGVLDIVHASVKAGNLFVWLHSTAMLVGGIFFFFVWLPENLIKMRVAVLPIVAILGIGLFALFSVLYPSSLPLMVEKGVFTTAAKVINIAAGVLLLLAGARFLFHYMINEKSEEILFANFCLLSAISSLFFYVSQLWNADWWFWHIVRFWAYIITLGVLLIIRIGAAKTEVSEEH